MGSVFVKNKLQNAVHVGEVCKIQLAVFFEQWCMNNCNHAFVSFFELRRETGDYMKYCTILCV